jgi:hypothetical protein
MGRELYARFEPFLYAYLAMVLGCIYYLFNWIEGIPFSERAGESQFFRVCWIGLYGVLIFKVLSQTRAFVRLVRHSALLFCFCVFVFASTMINGIQFDDAIKMSMYLLTILFAGWISVNVTVDHLAGTLYRIGAIVLVVHVLLFPLFG